MDNLKKVVGVILAAIALAVAFHALVGEFYGGLLPRPGMVWDILNYFMAGGVLVAWFTTSGPSGRWTGGRRTGASMPNT